MTRTSLSQTPNLSQASLPKKRKFCYHNELPASKVLYENLKHSKKKNHRRQAKIVDIINYFLQKGKGICYTQTKKWVELLKKEGFTACKKTIQNDLYYLEDLGLIWINSWTRPKHGGSGSVRHLITCWNLHSYETEYIEALNKKGLGKPDQTKKEFYQYKDRVMTENFPKHNAFLARKKSKKISSQKITVPSEETFLTENNSPLYVFKNYMYISPHPKNPKIARKRTKKRVRKRKATAPDTKKTKYAENPDQNQILWDPACLNDPEWVIQEAIHQGCDGKLAKQIVDAIQIKQIPLKTNLMRAILHVAKSKNQEYINAITTITEADRQRKYSDGVHDVFASSSGNYLKFLECGYARHLIQSRNLETVFNQR